MITLKSVSLVRLVAVSAVLACVGLTATASAAEIKTSANAAAAAAPTQRFEVGTMLVERHGERGTPLILIPGLASGAWVWEGTVKKLKDTHVLYVVTLAGFDGRPAVPGEVMDQALQSLKDLITTYKIAKPVLIGHSLGGILSIALAQQNSDLISGVIAIDGLPVFPGTETMPLSQRPALADSIKTRMAGMNQEQFADQQLQYMRGIGVLDGALAEQLAKLSSRSDPTATAEYMAEAFALDLRPGLPMIKVPVLLISPYNAPDNVAQNISETAKTAYYRSLMAGTPKVDVVSVAPARHFAMFDQSKLVGDAIGNYLKTLGAQ